MFPIECIYSMYCQYSLGYWDHKTLINYSLWAKEKAMSVFWVSYV